MPFKKGQSGNPHGRKPGPKKSTIERRELIARIVDRVLTDPTSIDELLNLEDKGKKWDIIAKLLPYYAPRLEAEQPGSEIPVVPFQSVIEAKLKEAGAA